MRFLLFFFALIMLASCADYNNDIYINEDGSGKVTMSYDASEMMGMLEMMKGMEDSDSEPEDDNNEEPAMEGGDDPEDIMSNFMSSMTSESGPSLGTDMDTTINFYNEMPDSIKSKLSKPELFKKVNISILSNKAAAKMVMSMDLSYDNMEELEEMYSEMSKLNNGEDEISQSIKTLRELKRNYELDLETGEVILPEQDFDGDMSELMGPEQGMGDEEMGEEAMAMMNMMLGEAGIVTTLHLPGAVLSCDDPNAIIEGKAITIKELYSDLMTEKKMKKRVIKFETR